MMPSKQEMLIEANNRGLLEGQKKAAFDEAVKRGIIVIPQSAQQPSPQEKPVQPSANDERAKLLDSYASQEGPIDAAMIGVGRGLTTLGRAVGLADKEDPTATQAIESLKDKRPIATIGGEIVGEALPFIAAAPLAGAGLTTGVGKVLIPAATKLATRVAASSAVGATQGALITRGQGADGEDQTKAGVLGGVVAGSMEALLPVLGRLGGSLVRKVTGKAAKGSLFDAAGKPTSELTAALNKSGLSIDDLNEQAITLLSKQTDNAMPNQAVRKAFLESQDLTPTKAQITRSASDFQAQQEVAKTSGRVRDALEAQEAILTTRFNNAITSTGGIADTPTSTVTDALVNKATKLDKQISTLYKQARESAPDAKNINFGRLRSKLQTNFGSDRASNGALSAIAGDMRAKGILDADNKLIGRVSIESAEDLRQMMNSLYDPQNSFRNGLLRQMKDALDDDVLAASGDDLFKQGRKAKHEFEKELTRAKISKFDSRKANLVRDVLENKIDPDSFSKDVVFSKKWRADDIQQLKDYIGTDEAGRAAFNDLRADVLTTIKEGAFIGPTDDAGRKALSAAALERQVNKIGQSKINVLFSAKERDFLNDMINVSKLREPVRGTALGRGPSAQGIARLEKKLADLPVMGALINLINVDAQGRIAISSAVKSLPRKIGTIERSLQGTIGPASAAGAITINQE